MDGASQGDALRPSDTSSSYSPRATMQNQTQQSNNVGPGGADTAALANDTKSRAEASRPVPLEPQERPFGSRRQEASSPSNLNEATYQRVLACQNAFLCVRIRIRLSQYFPPPRRHRLLEAQRQQSAPVQQPCDPARHLTRLVCAIEYPCVTFADDCIAVPDGYGRYGIGSRLETNSAKSTYQDNL